MVAVAPQRQRDIGVIRGATKHFVASLHVFPESGLNKLLDHLILIDRIPFDDLVRNKPGSPIC
ncbi:hypothetical protein H351_32365 (plasmid) [Rhodococcus erythropolis R138]|nr:hypothetical protein H351_32365 [Rhodococcus erythropolis R138]